MLGPAIRGARRELAPTQVPRRGHVVIATSAGRFATRVASALLHCGREVTFVSPRGAHPSGLANGGASVVYGDVESRGVWRAALRGASGLIWINDTNAIAERPAAALRAAAMAAESCERAHVQKVAVLSLTGGAQASSDGPVAILRDLERPFLASSPEVTIVRAGLFVDQLAAMFVSSAGARTLALPVPPGLPIPWVVAHDVVGELVHAVDAELGTGGVVELSGLDATTAMDLSRLIQASLEVPVRFVTLAPHQTAGHLRSLGVRPDKASWLAELWAAAGSGQLGERDERSRPIRARTSLESWAFTTMSNEARWGHRDHHQ